MHPACRSHTAHSPQHGKITGRQPSLRVTNYLHRIAIRQPRANNSSTQKRRMELRTPQNVCRRGRHNRCYLHLDKKKTATFTAGSGSSFPVRKTQARVAQETVQGTASETVQGTARVALMRGGRTRTPHALMLLRATLRACRIV